MVIYVHLKFYISTHYFYSWKQMQTVGMQEFNLEAKSVACACDSDMLHAH